jgi:hypothetical protein
MKIVPAMKRTGRIVTTMAGAIRDGTFGFRTVPVMALGLVFEGILGDRHSGHIRKSGGREPWYPRGTPMRNERQVSIVSREDMQAIAADLDIGHLDPGLIGANLVLEGIPDLSMIPPRTRLFFAGGTTLAVDGQNAPCRFSGRSIAAEYPDRDGLDLAFVRAAKRRRGLVAWVEVPGIIKPGEAVEARIPEQWTYAPS